MPKHSAYEPPKDAVAYVDLKYPVTAYGGEVRRLGFRRPKLRHLLVVDGLRDLHKVSKLVEVLADIPESAARDLDPVDIRAISGVFADFFPDGPEPETADA